MNKELEEAVKRLTIHKNPPIVLGYNIVSEKDIKTLLNYIDNSISKEVIEEKYKESENEVMKFSIPIIPRTKKNSSEIKYRRGKPYIAPSHLYENYEYEGIMSIPNKYKKKIDYPVNVKATYYVKRNARIDKTNLESALMDMLVAAGVLADDSALKPSIVVATDGSRVYYDKNNPHIEVEITRMEECYYGN